MCFPFLEASLGNDKRDMSTAQSGVPSAYSKERDLEMVDDSKLNPKQLAYVTGARGVIQAIRGILAEGDINRKHMIAAIDLIEKAINDAIEEKIKKQELDKSLSIESIIEAEVKKLRN